MDEQWVVLREAFNDVEADIILGLLAAHGIPARKKEKNAHISRVIMGQSLGLDIEVPASLLREARQLLSDIDDPNSAEGGG